MSQSTMPRVQVRDLSVSYGQGLERNTVVHDLSFDLGREKLAIVGESGSGKTTVGRALLRLLPAHAQVRASSLKLDGQDLLGLSARQMTALRGRRLSMIMQDPKYSLNPVMTIGQQVGEALDQGQRLTRSDRQAQIESLLQRVRMAEPQRVARQHPHELSGGMGQRVMIAMMLAQRPSVLVADEPTSALDVSVRQDVLRLLDEMVAEQGLSLLFISHDLSLVQRFCDRILVMFGGRVVESCAASDLWRAEHPYTQGLLASMPRLRQRRAVLPVLTRDPNWGCA